jgi:glycosyltransferase involved in cell wall biosynthesis/SAM-dependent methyltransferase
MARILTLTNWFPPHSRGGYEVLCDDVMTRLHQRGHAVEVLCSDERLSDISATAEPVFPVQRALRMYWRDGAPWRPGLRTQLEIERDNQRHLLDALDRVRPDVVSVWHMGALSLGLLTTVARRGIPMVYGICDDWLTYGLALDPWSGHWQRSPARRAAGWMTARLTGVPTVVSDLGATGCFCFISGVTRDRARTESPWCYPVGLVVPAGIDGTLYPAPDATPARPWSWEILYVGRLDPRKGTDSLLRAMARLPDDATLSMVGREEANERWRLDQLAGELGLSGRVTFRWVERADTPSVYIDHDCLVFPSTWSEPFGLVPLEAMACGVPVVATGVGGSGEFLVDGVNCLLYPPDDEVALAKAVSRLAGDAALRGHLRDNGWQTAARFDVRHMADAYEECHLAAAARTLDRLELARPAPASSAPLSGEPNLDPLARHHRHSSALFDQPDPDAGAVKEVYRALGNDWWASYDPARLAVPVLSAPETTPVVIARFRDVSGLLLDAGCGPNPAVSIALARDPRRNVVSVDIGLGTVRVAVAEAARHGVRVLGVVADIEHLPFRQGAFAGMVCDDTIEHLPDDTAGVRELARVAAPGATVVLATPNRRNALVLKARVRDWWQGRRRSPQHYFVSASHLREYTWAEFEALVAPAFTVAARLPVGWEQTRKRRLVSRILVGPLRDVSQMIVLEVRPK